jgi:hypothetical protein
VRGDLGKRRDRSGIAFDRNHAMGAKREQSPRQSARAGTDLDDRDALQRAGGARDPRGKVEIEKKILAERFPGCEIVPADDFAKRRQIVDHAKAGEAARVCGVAIRAASRSASIKLVGFARPVPATAKAVP